ncbi:short-chain dehydrogenase [Niastella yeongjuensis]|uniref:Short-chain dehydrogenase n=1 Tax=Niastella yeongjuensis TaxID=354355 RepID=A0A1V9EXE3_9BACT|nr:SDR family oxidoreductase [Niastella yeongjuensis]OQP50772.1 short-chain dehydrogenase [Niastella yeongjuensis]SEN18710.1 NAD(P)-dependent dehydrogenase, short-chain alcohol dehydrogenase family [Niastella yeongjuensis]
MFRLDNKTAIITGGGSGIGKAIATVFAQQGASVHILDMDEQGATNVVKEITAAGGKGQFYKCDVSKQADVKQIVDGIAANGSIDILINNAGIAHIGTADTTPEADFDRLVGVNVKGVYNCLHTVIPHMKQNGGSILNMASIASLVGIPDRFAYSMTKGAVVGMTLSVAKDYLKYNIRCNCISPARVHTPFVDGFLSKNYPGKEAEMFEKLSKTQPIGRMGKPEEIGYLALYLCSNEASFITGCDYPIDGGFTKLNN